MVAGHHQHANALRLKLIQLAHYILVALQFAVFGQVAGNEHGGGAQFQGLVNERVKNLGTPGYHAHIVFLVVVKGTAGFLHQ